MKKIVLFISSSLDGYIATPDDDISWLSMVESEGEDYGYYNFIQTVDTYIVGRRTYDIVRKITGGEFPQAEQLDCYVLSRSKHGASEGVTFVSDPVIDFVTQLKQASNTADSKNIYCDGGSEVVHLLLSHGLIDEIVVSIIPILLGNGKRLFKPDFPQAKLQLLSCESFDSGLVQLRYATASSEGE